MESVGRAHGRGRANIFNSSWFFFPNVVLYRIALFSDKLANPILILDKVHL